MNRVAQYLQEHLDGEVMTSADARDFFSTDSSIFKLVPQVIVYPRSESDIRKLAKFSWQLAERGRNIPVTCRGAGTDFGGGAIGSGILINFPAHYNKLLTLDPNKGLVTVQPGINLGALQQVLMTHGHHLPAVPSSLEYSTAGGAIANNAGGKRSIKYGSTKDYVTNLRVVLANGEVITTGLISKKELNKKKGLPTLEGEIYRTIDGIITDNADLLSKTIPVANMNNSGYDLWSIKDGKGNFDLTKLIVGSQGTLGIISEASFEADAYTPETTLIVSYFDSLDKATDAVARISKLGPSALELIDSNLIEFLEVTSPNHLKKVIQKPFPKIVLIAEFDDLSRRVQKRKTKKIMKQLEILAYRIAVTNDPFEQEDYWKIRDSASAVLWQSASNKKPVPIIGDGIVPPERLNEYLVHFYRLCDEFDIDKAVWGHAGDANLQMMPLIDLGQLGDRQKVFKIMNAYYKLVTSLGGSIAGQYNDGRLRAPYVQLMYGHQIYDLFRQVKQVFDPYDSMNPGVKMGSQLSDIQKIVRTDYNMNHLYSYMPRT